MKTAFLLGRLAFGGYFIYAGINHFKQHKNMTEYTASKKVPAPDLAVAVSGAALIFGGTSILLGIKPKYGAAAIAGFLVAVSPIMHDFWRVEDPNQRMNDMINFGKNVAMLGGALALGALEEPWPASVPVGQATLLERVGKAVRRGLAA